MKIVKSISRFLFFIMVMVIGILIYITFVERSLLIVKNESIDIKTEYKQSLKIVQFTDTHVGQFYSLDKLQKAVNKINRQQADIVIFTGDLLDIAWQFNEQDQVAPILKKIEASIGKYAVFGNRDYGGGAVRVYETMMEEAGFTVLADEKVQVQEEDKRISIFGADDYLLGNPDVEKLMEGINENDLNLLIVHEPDAVDYYASYPIDIAVTGHSHGGQVRIPFAGALIRTNLCDKYLKGRYELENKRKTTLFVSSGLGNTKVPFRLGNIPEIVVFQVK